MSTKDVNLAIREQDTPEEEPWYEGAWNEYWSRTGRVFDTAIDVVAETPDRLERMTETVTESAESAARAATTAVVVLTLGGLLIATVAAGFGVAVYTGNIPGMARK